VILVVALFQAVLSDPYNFSSLTLNLVMALGVAYLTYWLFIRAMNLQDGKENEPMLEDWSWRKLILYTAAFVLIIFGCYLSFLFSQILIQWYLVLIASNIMWLLFLSVPIMAVFLTAKAILDRAGEEDYQYEAIAEQSAEPEKSDEAAESVEEEKAPESQPTTSNGGDV
jgi:hypothetical protein